MLIQLLSTLITHICKCGLECKQHSNNVGNICWVLEATYHINICWKVKPHFWTPLLTEEGPFGHTGEPPNAKSLQLQRARVLAPKC